ncbi:MAG: NAD(P)-dependent oxidoreductase [bacterium]
MKEHTLLITGAAGYVGSMLVHQFSERKDVRKIICLDKEKRPELLEGLDKIVWINANTSDGGWQETVKAEKPDIIIHTAWQIRELYGKRDLQWRWNIDGSDAVFDFAFSTPGIKKIIHFSTVASYGARNDNTLEHKFTEDEPLRDSEYLYAIEKKVSEEHLKHKYQSLRARSSVLSVSIIRPASITGPKGKFMRDSFGLQSVLSGKFKDGKKSFSHRLTSLFVAWMPVTAKWCRQFIHEDDICDIVAHLAFDDSVQNSSGFEIYNACPPGPVVLGNDMAKAVGKKTLKVQPWMIRIVFCLAWNLTHGKIPTSRGGWKSYSYPIIVDGSKITRKLGLKYRMNSLDAFTKEEGRYMRFVSRGL